MATKAVTLYIVPRTREAMREEHDRSLSGRINQITDRWLEVIRLDGKEVRGFFTDDQWTTLIDAFSRVTSRGTREPLQAVALIPSLRRELSHDKDLLDAVDELSAGDAFVLIELLELEQPPLPPDLRAKRKRPIDEDDE